MARGNKDETIRHLNKCREKVLKAKEARRAKMRESASKCRLKRKSSPPCKPNERTVVTTRSKVRQQAEAKKVEAALALLKSHNATGPRSGPTVRATRKRPAPPVNTAATQVPQERTRKSARVARREALQSAAPAAYGWLAEVEDQLKADGWESWGEATLILFFEHFMRLVATEPLPARTGKGHGLALGLVVQPMGLAGYTELYPVVTKFLYRAMHVAGKLCQWGPGIRRAERG